MKVDRITVVLYCLLFTTALAAQDPSPQDENATSQKVLAYLRERDQLYRTIWKAEMVAQGFETAFIDLWDSLRTSRYDPQVLKDFRFDHIKLGGLKAARELGGGVSVRLPDGSSRTLTREGWARWIDERVAAGYVLEKCEFHHKKFGHRKDGRLVSDFGAALYLVQPKASIRYTVEGTLRVLWSSKPGENKKYYPEQIDATNLQIVSRQGEPVFTEVFSAPKASLQNATLILYDLDGDGDSEIIDPQRNRIYRNDGTGAYSEERMMTDPGAPGEVLTSVMADFTGDGNADLLFAGRHSSGAVRLALLAGRRGALVAAVRWLEVPGLELTVPTVMSAGDVDADGDLDLWIAQYKAAYINGQMPTPYYDANDGFPSYLLLNDGKAVFHDVTEAAGLAPKRHRRTYSGSLVDLDSDDDLDLLVVSDFSGVDLYHNQGAGQFLDVTASSVDNRSLFGMSHTFADFNGDGWLDIYATGMASTTARRLERLGLGRKDFPKHNAMRLHIAHGNRMYLAQADSGAFLQPDFKGQIGRTGWTWGCVSVDFDSDGDRDIYAVNGHESRTSARDYCSQFWCLDIYSGSSGIDLGMAKAFELVGSNVREKGISWNGFEKNHLLMNHGGKGFTNVAYSMGVAFERDSRHAVSDDINGDGRPDLIVSFRDAVRRKESIHVFRNDFPTSHDWIGVRLREEGHGFSPIGAKITLSSPSGRQVAQIVTGDSFRTQHAPVCQFGLGNDSTVHFLEVRWLNGTTRRIDNPAVGTYHLVRP